MRPSIQPGIPKMRQIILDTETTGLSPKAGHRVIEIGCVELVNRRLTGNHFHYYLNPDREIDPGAQAVHGITAEFLADKPRFKDIIESLIEYVQDAEIIIHNAEFDLGFLDHEFKLCGKKFLPFEEYVSKIVCTLQMARNKHPGQKNNLDVLCKRYGVDNSKRDLHGALLDSEILADVYLAMTGGQETLGLSEQVSEIVDRQVIETQEMVNAQECVELPVVRATAEEIEAHAKFFG
jgi:DNA polymerase III subunit epsilon